MDSLPPQSPQKTRGAIATNIVLLLMGLLSIGTCISRFLSTTFVSGQGGILWASLPGIVGAFVAYVGIINLVRMYRK